MELRASKLAMLAGLAGVLVLVRTLAPTRGNDAGLHAAPTHHTSSAPPASPSPVPPAAPECTVSVWLAREESGQVQVLLQPSRNDPARPDALVSECRAGERPKHAAARLLQQELALGLYDVDFLSLVARGPHPEAPSAPPLFAFVSMLPGASARSRLRGSATHVPADHGDFTPLAEVVRRAAEDTRAFGVAVRADLGSVQRFLYPFVVTALGAAEGARQCGLPPAAGQGGDDSSPRLAVFPVERVVV